MATFLVSLFFIGGAHASMSVGGLITKDTTWSQNGSSYTLTGPVGVPVGVTLTIEPGVTVDFGSYFLEINGTLSARGTSTSQINMVSESNGATGVSSNNPMQQLQFMPSSVTCTVSNVAFSHVSISAKSCSPTITNCVFNDPFWTAVLSTNGGSVTFSGNVVENVPMEGISVGGSSTVINNLFNITSGQATAIVAHDNAYVSNNEILSFYRGITTDSASTINGNVIINCSDAAIYDVSAVADIEGNYIANSQVGVNFEGGKLQNNAILNNNIGIQMGSPPQNLQIANNNIVGNTQNSVSITFNSNIDVSNNWWGTTDQQAINQTIHDSKNDFTLGTVNFVPFLTQPSTSAPTTANIDLSSLPTNPTQTPTAPTQASSQDAQPTETPKYLSSLGDSSSGGGKSTPFNFLGIAEITVVVVAIIAVVGGVLYVNTRGGKESMPKRKPRKQKKP